MNKTLDAALDSAFRQVQRSNGDLLALPAAVRTLLLVHAAQGVIDNGGFQYFFESDFPGTPPYSLFVDAYQAIGAADAAHVLAQAVGLFPFPDPHLHLAARESFLEKYLDAPASPFDALAEKLCGNKTIWQALTTFATTHAASFP